MRILAASIALIAMAAVGCANNGNLKDAQSIESATTESTRYPGPPRLADVDPCSLIRQNEVDQSTGVGGLKPKRDDNADPEFADMDACTWGTPGGFSSQGSMGVVTAIEEPWQQTDELSLRMQARLGRQSTVMDFDPDSCTALAFYSQNRRVTVLINPSDEKLATHPPVRDVDTVCDRSMDLMAAIFQRVPWE